MASPVCPKSEKLLDYCLGKLELAELEQVEGHLSACHDCSKTIEMFDAKGDTLVGELRKPPPPDEFRNEPHLAQALAGARQMVGSGHVDAALRAANPSPAQPARPTDINASLGETLPRGSWPEGQQPRTLNDFAQCLAASGLLSIEQTREFIQTLPKANRPGDAKALAMALVNAERLSPYQAKALYQGKPFGLLLGDREIVDFLGGGGMGQVFKARHRRLERIEAVKLLSPKLLGTPDAIARFHKESRAAARLSHPNIVATYDAGDQNGTYFLAMEFIDGCDLSRLVQQQGPLPVDQAVDCILQAAEGLQAAHEAGVVHRDIKPQNLLLDRKGRVKVLDMGLARFSDSEEALEASRQGLTQTGQVIGTLDYMSPEQALDTSKAGVSTDIYALGCTLFFLLTARPPYDGENVLQKLLAHSTHPIPSLPQFRPEVSPQLDAVFAKMVAKKSEDRYQTMPEVITALRASATPQAPVLTAPSAAAPAEGSGFGYLSQVLETSDLPRRRKARSARAPARSKPKRSRKAIKWSDQEIVKGILIACVGALLVILGAIYLLRTPYGDIEIDLADHVAKNVEVKLLQRGKVVDIADAENDWSLSLKEGKYEVKLGRDTSKFELSRNVVTITEGATQLVKVSLKDPPPKGPIISPSRPDYVPADAVKFGDSFYKMFPKKLTWEEAKRRCEEMKGQLACAETSEEVNYLSQFGGDVEVWLGGRRSKDGKWTWVNGQPFSHSKWGSGEPNNAGNKEDCLTRRPDHFWNDVENSNGWANGFICEWPNSFGEAGTFSPALIRAPQLAEIRDMSTEPDKTFTFKPTLSDVGSPSYEKVFRFVSGAPAGMTIESRTGTITWPAEQQAEQQKGKDYTITIEVALQGVENFKTTRSFTLSVPKVYYVIAAPDAILTKPSTVWRDTLTLKGHTRNIESVVFSPDGRWIASGSRDHTIKVWDALSGKEAHTFNGHADSVFSLAFSFGGRRIASGSWDTTIKLWDVATGQEMLTLKGHKGGVDAVAFSPDGRRIASGSDDHTVKLWDAATGHELLTLKGHSQLVRSVAFSRNGERIASGSADSSVRVWDADTGQEMLMLKGHVGWVNTVAFSPDNQRIASGSEDRTVKLWDASTGHEIRTLTGHSGWVGTVAFSLDGRQIASGSGDNTVKVWDTSTGQNTVTLRGHTDDVFGVAFSPDSRRIASGSWDDTVKVWELRSDKLTDGATNVEQSQYARHCGLPVDLTNSTSMKLRLIPPGEFLMGSPGAEKDRRKDEGPQHRVRIAKPFYLGVYEVTREEYQQVMGTNPSSFSAQGGGKDKVAGLDTSRFPVENVSWEDAVEFCRKLSTKEGKTYRLPTEAEWEYACRAGTQTPFHFGSALNSDQANCDGNFPYGTEVKGKCLGRTTTVGQYTPNRFGLFDMHGNVWEWCSDWYGEDYYAKSAAEDPPGPSSGDGRVLRGGSWNNYACDARSAVRGRNSPGGRYNYHGFRVVCVPSGTTNAN